MLKAAIFMDHSNIASPVLKEGKFKDYIINYRRLRKILIQGFICVGAYAFLGVTKPIKPKKKRFLDYLEMSGFTPLYRELIRRSDGTYAQKGLDIFMSFQIDNMIPQFDVAVIVSGDADFLVIVELLKNSQKDVQIWSWKESMSKDLLKEVGEDNVFYIDSIWDRIKRKRKRSDP